MPTTPSRWAACSGRKAVVAGVRRSAATWTITSISPAAAWRQAQFGSAGSARISRDPGVHGLYRQHLLVIHLRRATCQLY